MGLEKYCIYIRKSRKDMEAEEQGEGDTLARHEAALMDLAHKMGLHITAIYKEIVSGETIAARPVMQQLLNEIEQNVWSGVLVMEIERLARGDTIDQGIVAQAFKYSNTKIITPLKTYDPTNEYDEEYFEFGLFMSRREYKTINRRLQRGRIASVKEGKYVGNIPPYGYQRVKLAHDKGFTLSPDPQEAPIVQNIFNWYLYGIPSEDKSHIGISLIARRLNDLNIPTRRGGSWTGATVITILRNPVYAGYVKWNARPHIKHSVNGQITAYRPRASFDEMLLAQGMHPALIDIKTFESVQDMLKNNPQKSVPGKYIVKNPLAGLIICGSCGRKMVRRPYSNGQAPSIMCADPQCPNISSYLHLVEDHIIKSLNEVLQNILLDAEKTEVRNAKIKEKASLEKSLQSLNAQLEKNQAQFDALYDLVEQGIYDRQTFLMRSNKLHEKALELKNQIEKASAQLNNIIQTTEESQELIPKIQSILQAYETNKSAETKNALLKSVIERVIYVKNSKDDPAGFEITIYPKLSSVYFDNL